jgi:hypothetical protein
MEQALSRFGLVAHTTQSPYQFSRESVPSEFFRDDDYFGYAANTGEFTLIYKRRSSPQRSWERFPIKVTINEDGSRWTGKTALPAARNIFILGDSHVFGSGVNDEQTFSYHLQMSKPTVNVQLFALGGYALSQSYLRFRLLKDKLRPTDVIVIGYGDYYDLRNVAAPSRLREVEQWVLKYDPAAKSKKIPKVDLKENGGLNISLVEEDCRRVRDYCNGPDPDPGYMTKISARLITEIANGTNATVYLLAFYGNRDNPVYRQIGEKVKVIWALPSDFDYFIADDIEGFDPHPGPYWHYAIGRKLIEAMKST